MTPTSDDGATGTVPSRGEPVGRDVRGESTFVPFWFARSAAYSWRALVVAAAIYAALWLLTRLSVVVLPLIIAIILSTLCIPVAAWLHRRGVPSGVASAIVVVGGLAIIAGGLAALTPSFVDQITELRPAIDDGIDYAIDTAEGFGYDQAQLSDLIQQAREGLSGSASTILSGLAGGVAAAISTLTGLALLVVLLFFFVKDADQITGWVLARTPEHRRELVSRLGDRAWRALSGYVRGTAAIAAIDAIGVGIGLAIIGVPLVLPLSVIVFLGAFLPVVGALLAGLIAVLVALAAGGLATGLWTLVLIIVVQQIEGNVLQPMIMRRAVALHPIVVLTALAVGATLAGIVGAFLSLPVAAVLAAIGNELRLRADAREETAAVDSTATAGEPGPQHSPGGA